MAQITLNKKQLIKFSEFMAARGTKQWFMAKDDGAYIGATRGSDEDGDFENMLFHFKGMNPKTNEDAYDNARHAFGGDDFGEHFPSDIVHGFAKDDKTIKMVLKVGATSMSISSWEKK
tara:strand:- start:709 stop:1062 length:354 start_codon:yes stop_codon:yes gene_type:complete